jgi:cytochrome c553
MSDRELRVRAALAIVALGRCVVCHDAPAGSGVVHFPYDEPNRAVVYALCSRCHGEPGWQLRAEAVLYREAV